VKILVHSSTDHAEISNFKLFQTLSSASSASPW